MKRWANHSYYLRPNASCIWGRIWGLFKVLNSAKKKYMFAPGLYPPWKVTILLSLILTSFSCHIWNVKALACLLPELAKVVLLCRSHHKCTVLSLSPGWSGLSENQTRLTPGREYGEGARGGGRVIKHNARLTCREGKRERKWVEAFYTTTSQGALGSHQGVLKLTFWSEESLVSRNGRALDPMGAACGVTASHGDGFHSPAAGTLLTESMNLEVCKESSDGCHTLLHFKHASINCFSAKLLDWI